MTICVKLTGFLYDTILSDLKRPHAFAAERVGFALGRIGSLSNGRALVLLTQYHSLPDDQYIDDPTVGAMIDREAMTWAMQAAYYGRATREGVFHVHLHDHDGETGMSPTDFREIPKLMPGLQSVGRDAAHGIVILSRNHGSCWVWLPGSTGPVRAVSVSIIGAPICVFDRRTRN